MTDAKRPKPHVPPVDTAWLAKRREELAGPAIAIVDSHIHLWDFSEPEYFGDVYRADAERAGITSSVFVECTMGYRTDGPEALRPVGEVEFACDQARAHSRPGFELAAAIVGMVDMTLGEGVEDVLEQLVLKADGRLRGVRIRAAHDPDPVAGYGAGAIPGGYLAQNNVRAGVKKLHEAGLSLDLYVFHTQLDEVSDLARAFPGLPIVVNHIGGPLGVGPYARDRDAVFHDWKAKISNLARHQNVFIKVGGFGISRIGIVSAKGRDLPPDSHELATTFQPWFDHCIAAFGAAHCMFGSNFPVDKTCVDLVVLVNAMKKLAAGLSDNDVRALFGGTARHFYKF